MSIVPLFITCFSCAIVLQLLLCADSCHGFVVKFPQPPPCSIAGPSPTTALGVIAKKGWSHVEDDAPGYGRRFYNDPSKPLPSYEQRGDGSRGRNFHIYPKAYRNGQPHRFNEDAYYPPDSVPPAAYHHDSPYDDYYYDAPQMEHGYERGDGFYGYSYEPNYAQSQHRHDPYQNSHQQPYRVEPYQQLSDKQRQKSSETSSNSNKYRYGARGNGDEIVRAINDDRARNRMPPLLIHPALTKAAQLALATMDSNQSPVPLARRLQDVAYFADISDLTNNANNQYEIHVQNGATSQSVQQTITTLLNNPKHRDQLLSQRWQHIGVATNNNGSHWIITLAAG